MSATQTQHRLFVRVAPGLEAWLVKELHDLGIKGKVVLGGIELRADNEQLWDLHYRSRLAESVRVRLRSFQARSFEELIAGLKRLPWHAYLTRDAGLEVSVTSHRSRLWHSDAVAERVRTVLAHFVANPQAFSGDTTQNVFVRITGDIVQPSVDASGELLHRRGRRTHVGAAPLRETLAAALVRMLEAPEASATTLWDPFCGSGCLPLEWLESNLALAPGRDRHFAFEHWPIHDGAAYRQWLDARAVVLGRTLTCLGSDIDKTAIASAQANAQAYGLSDHCNWLCGDFESFVDRIPEGTSIVSNPPYGVRLGDGESFGRLMQRFEKVLTSRPDLRPAVILVPLPHKPWRALLDWRTLAQFHNGGLRVQALYLGRPN